MAYDLPAWVIAEFLRKRTLVETPDYWDSELHEQYGVFTVEELRRISRAIGFNTCSSIIENVHELGFYGDILPGEGVRVLGSDGNDVDQAATLPSHLYAVLAKTAIA